MPYQKCEEGYEDKCKETPKKVNYICFISQKIFFCHRVCWVLIDWMTPFSRLVRRWRSIVVSGQRERSMTTPPASILIMMLILIMILIRILMTFPAYPDDNLTPWSWSMMIPPADLDPDKKSCWRRSWSWWQHLLTKILILILVHDATSCWSKSWSWSQWSRFKYWSDLIRIKSSWTKRSGSSCCFKTYVVLPIKFINSLFVIPIIFLFFVDWLLSKSRSCF